MLATEPRVRSQPPARSRHGLVRIIGVAGRIFVGGGVVLLLFTTYLLWGTGVYTKQEQRRAAADVARNPIVTEAGLADGTIPAARPATPAKSGDPLFTLKIPKIGVETVVVQGVGRDELKKGPGLFSDCRTARDDECVDGAKYPGEKGNVPVSGHRTTYGAPFYRLNELESGDVIDFVSGRVRYRYQVREHRIVDPIGGFEVVEQNGRDEVTLTTCHPRFSAAQRLVVHGDYVGATLLSSSPKLPAAARADDQARPVVSTDVLFLSAVAGASALGALGLSRRFRFAAGAIATFAAGTVGLWVGIFPRVLALMPANF